MSKRIPSHPGGLIKRTYMEPLNLKAVDVAEALEISPGTFSRLLNEKIDLSPEMAVKLSKVLGRTPESWMNLQANHTLARLTSDPKFENWNPTKFLSADGLMIVKESRRKKPAVKKSSQKKAAA